MRVGDIDGFGTVYDERGELILSEEENILVKDNIGFHLHVKGRVFLEPLIDPSPESHSICYRTNLRLVGIREPSVWGAKSDMTPFGMPTAVAKMAKAKSLKKMGAKEYFEIPLKEIVKVKIFSSLLTEKKAVGIYVTSPTGKKYHLFLDKCPPTTVHSLVGDILKQSDKK